MKFIFTASLAARINFFKEAFTYIDKEFASVMLAFIPNVHEQNFDVKSRFRQHFKKIWSYALADKERCSFFIRYYYSRCYTKAMLEERQKIYSKVLKMFETAFFHSGDAWWFFNHILDVTFSSAVKVLREEIPENEQTEERIFELLYSAIEPHLKK